MPKNKLFDEDSDEEVAIKTENEYAKRYDAWREKEEKYKLEQKYGSKALNSDASISSDSEDESDEPLEVSEETETQFLKTLALLKTKDPRIYDPGYKFFDEKVEKEKEKDDQKKKVVFTDSDDDDDDDSGNIFSIEKKAEVDEEKQEQEHNKDGKLKDYLLGKVEHVEEDVEKELAPLKALWSDPKLNEGEAFLRDYILNKRYLEEGDAGPAGDKLRDDADLEADEEIVEEQGKFERAYNFRFEEPDDEYLKRFPRTMNYIRPKDDKRSRKRAEVRARKEAEKRSKMEEIARLKALKLKEVQEKIAKLKEVTGNQELAFNDEDIEGDFDPEEHDRRMRAIFDEQYYGDADDKKPEFPDLDEELEIENWEKYEDEFGQGEVGEAEGPHCEDEDFNMDADYDPKKARENLLEELKRGMGKKRRNRKKKSKLAQLLEEEKPKFIPEAERSYAQFMEEYYKMDCEDVIGGDLPTRFKYREVVPNDYGLSIEEILLADDKELTQWVPLKKIVKHRPPAAEKGEVKTYAIKAADQQLKKKILPSLFKELPQEPELVVPVEASKKKKKKKKKAKENVVENKEVDEDEVKENNTENNDDKIDVKVKHKNEKSKENDVNNVKSEESVTKTDVVSEVEETTENTEVKSKKKKKKKGDQHMEDLKSTEVEESKSTDKVLGEKKKKHKINFVVESVSKDEEPSTSSDVALNFLSKGKKSKTNSITEKPEPQGGKLKRKSEPNSNESSEVPNKKNKPNQTNGNAFNKNKKQIKKKNKGKGKQDEKPGNPLNKLSDERLKAYGLNPKKYRGFLKYKKF
ncbi:Protein KRI1-like [Papilio xuthus]|uniref:Protein KRI1 homolog n=1 Tax=Papilio xuthus TaxID=66420 RepID=A0A0N0P9F3_PAPXU|nr:Protein KRI1-like [Papilio xuthus]